MVRRRIPVDIIITPELAKDICRLSFEIRRQIGILVSRRGEIRNITVGDHDRILIPDTPAFRTLPGRLKGLRCIHTHLKNEPLSQDDLTDLTLLRLDIMTAITIDPAGQPNQVYNAHILPEIEAIAPYRLLAPVTPWQMNIDCLALIEALEAEIERIRILADTGKYKERALLVSITTDSKKKALDSLEELRELARSAGISISGTLLQQRKKIDSRFLMGIGKLQELSILALRQAVTIIIFDQELNASQMRSIADRIELRIIDRTQLILDIFAQRAQSREGKLQVELAQLKYLLPRLVTKNTAMSRLTGGIGGRGPGETKLEINRRRARERIRRLESDIQTVRLHRKQQRAKRSKKNLPIISIIGYTNAGKSTLLNHLTNSHIHAADRLFATLDPSSRRLKFPEDMEVIITDTVGFIRDLPKDLMVAFRATLEELENADLFVHVIDSSHPLFKKHIASVDKIIQELNLSHIPCIRALNKKDLLNQVTIEKYAREFEALSISAYDRSTFAPLIEKMATTIKSIPMK